VEISKKLTASLDYLKPHQIKQICDAYSFATKAHSGQKRYTGHDYIVHPVEVTCILASMRLDTQTLIAALLHDVIEDTLIDKATLIKQFGRQVAELVDGVSKLTQIQFESRKEAQAENFRKMLLAMSKDIRVILIKLADRLHNIRTLDSLPLQKRRRIARETLEIYAPIAKRLGMRELSVEFEDLSFKFLYPKRYEVLNKSVMRVQGSRKTILREINQALDKKLNKANITHYKIKARQKHLYSIYKKMRDKSIAFSDVTDVYAVRIIVKSIDQCYQVLGLAHQLYTPVPEQFKDYIALPKNNGYQSLHTVLFGPRGVPIEVQIRTPDMHELANSGIAAHWLYKSGTKSFNETQMLTQQWMKNLLDIQRATGNSIEFIENVKIDLFPNDVYVFTPKGGIFELPKGATAIDFAYAIHTDVGNTCFQAKIDRQIKPLSTPLCSGQTVEIITSKHARPSPEWLKVAITGKALSNIRYYLKHQQRKHSIELGRQLLKIALKQVNLSLRRIPEPIIQNVLKETNTHHIDDLFEDIGLGNRIAILTASRFIKNLKKSAVSQTKESAAHPGRSEKTGPLIIRGTEGMVVQFARCCHPIPGDPISAIIKAGKGVVIHMQQCKKLSKLQSLPNQCLPVRWADNIDSHFTASINIDVIDQHGLLALLTKIISDAKAGIVDINIIRRDGDIWIIQIDVLVKGRRHLAAVLRGIRQLHFVVHINRA